MGEMDKGRAKNDQVSDEITAIIICLGINAAQERVQQLTGPRFWAIVLDRSAVGQPSAKGLGRFSGIDF